MCQLYPLLLWPVLPPGHRHPWRHLPLTGRPNGCLRLSFLYRVGHRPFQPGPLAAKPGPFGPMDGPAVFCLCPADVLPLCPGTGPAAYPPPVCPGRLLWQRRLAVCHFAGRRAFSGQIAPEALEGCGVPRRELVRCFCCFSSFSFYHMPPLSSTHTAFFYSDGNCLQVAICSSSLCKA